VSERERKKALRLAWLTVALWLAALTLLLAAARPGE
jgi:fatty acid desaturase